MKIMGQNYGKMLIQNDFTQKHGDLWMD